MSLGKPPTAFPILSIWPLPMIKIAAVVATHNRPELLARRYLASIARQRRPTDYLLVVDDSDISMRPVNAEAVAALSIEGTRIIYLENRLCKVEQFRYPESDEI